MERIEIIPRNAEVHKRIQNKCKTLTGNDDVERFIYFFNENLLNKENNSIKDLADEITYSYSNVFMSNNYLVIQSEEEVAVDYIFELIEIIRFVTKLKSLAQQMVRESFSVHERIIFKRDTAGTPHIIDPKDNKNIRRHWTRMSLSSNYDDVVYNNPYLIDIQEIYDKEGDFVAFEIEKILNIDTSFVLELKNIIIGMSEKKENKILENQEEKPLEEDEPDLFQIDWSL